MRLPEYRSPRYTVALIDNDPRLSLFHRARPRCATERHPDHNIKDLKASHGIVSLLLNPQGHISRRDRDVRLSRPAPVCLYSMIRERLIEGPRKIHHHG